MHSGGASIFGDCIPLIANMTAVSPLPTENLGDAFLSVLRDWWIMPARFSVDLVIRLESANAAIIAQHKAAAEAAATPTRKGHSKRTHEAGRR